MILSFEEFIKESYNSGLKHGTHSFDIDANSLIDDILDEYAHKVLKMQNKKERDEWVLSVWDEVKAGYNEDTHKDFEDEFAGEPEISCNFDYQYSKGSYDEAPYGDYEVIDVDFHELSDIIDAFKKYAISDPNAGKYIEDNIKDRLYDICKDEIDLNNPDGEEYEPDPDDHYDRIREER